MCPLHQGQISAEPVGLTVQASRAFRFCSDVELAMHFYAAQGPALFGDNTSAAILIILTKNRRQYLEWKPTTHWLWGGAVIQTSDEAAGQVSSPTLARGGTEHDGVFRPYFRRRDLAKRRHEECPVSGCLQFR